MFDVLKDLPPEEVATWYGRLADLIEQMNAKVRDPLAPRLLRHWLHGKGKTLIFAPPEHLKKSKYVVETLKQHRGWYLTNKRFKNKWVGVLPRVQGQSPHPRDVGYEKWYIPVTMMLHSLVEIDVKWFGDHTPGDADLMTALRGFQLRTLVSVLLLKNNSSIVRNASSSGDWYEGKFILFLANVEDRYDFDPDEHFTVPNPDYKNRFNVAKPVTPKMEKTLVFHSNAIRIEKAGLAAPYDLRSEPWGVTDLDIMGPAPVNVKRRI